MTHIIIEGVCAMLAIVVIGWLAIIVDKKSDHWGDE